MRVVFKEGDLVVALSERLRKNLGIGIVMGYNDLDKYDYGTPTTNTNGLGQQYRVFWSKPKKIFNTFWHEILKAEKEIEEKEGE